jgi:hypothetical protein
VGGGGSNMAGMGGTSLAGSGQGGTASGGGAAGSGGGVAGAAGAGTAGTGGMGTGGMGTGGMGTSPLAPITDYKAMGPFAVTVEKNTGPNAGYTVFRPTMLGQNGLMHAPIVF